MDIRILGPLEVTDGGRLLPLGGTKERALLAALALRANNTIAAGELIDALWEVPPATAPKVVQVYVSHLRKALGAERIVTRASGYELQVGDGELDLSRFERLVADARIAEPDEAASLLREALALWRGDALTEFEREPFALIERQRLTELRLAAIEARIDADLALWRHADVLTELDALVAAHPFRERLSVQRMLALYRCGRQAEALTQYHETRGRLVDELGLQPGPELQELERAILVQDPALGVRAGEAPIGLPTGTVTFLFTDIEGSTALLRRMGERYGELIGAHLRLLRQTIESRNGSEVDTQGDSLFAVFRRAKDAVSAAVAAQVALSSNEWSFGQQVRVRMGIHTGEPAVGPDRYFGLGVHRVSRIMAAAHGGQILVSQVTRDLLADDPSSPRLVDLGQHKLPGFDEPERLYQVVADGLRDEFPPLRTALAGGGPFVGREEALAEAAQAALAPPRRSGRRAAFVTALLVAATAIVVAVLLVDRGNHGTSPALGSVVPNSVAVIDPERAVVTRAIKAGDAPGAMAISPGRLWVGNNASTTLSEIDVRGRRVDSTLGLPNAPDRLVAGEGALWIANAFTGTVSRLDIATGFLSRPFRPQPRSVGRLALTTGFGSLWVGSQDNVVARVNPRTFETVATIRGIDAPQSLVAFGPGVWVIRLGHADVLRIDPKTNRIADTTTLGGIPIAIASGEGAVWALTPEDGKVWRIDPKTSNVNAVVDVSAIATSPLAAPSNAIAASEGSVWVAGGASGRLIQIDPHRNDVARVIRIGRPLGGVVAGEGAVWVSVR